MTGRPRSRCPKWLTGEAREALVEAVTLGNTVTTAAAAAGIDPALLYEWASSADKNDKIFAAFTAELRTARAQAEMTMTEALTADAKGGFLVRRYTKEYPNGDVETDESFSPPNGRIALEWLRNRNGQQWGSPDSPSDLLGQPAGAGAVPGAGGAQSAGIIAGLADRLHGMLRLRAAERETAELDGSPPEGAQVISGNVLPPGTDG